MSNLFLSSVKKSYKRKVNTYPLAFTIRISRKREKRYGSKRKAYGCMLTMCCETTAVFERPTEL